MNSKQPPSIFEQRKEQYLERPLPSSEETERVLLGAVLLDNSLMEQIVIALDPEDFYSPLNRRVYNAMVELHKAGRLIDPILIIEQMKTEGDVEALGGVSTVANLTYGLPHYSNLSEHISIVREKSALRQIVRVCNQITAEALSEEDKAESVLDRGQDDLKRILDAKNNLSSIIVWADQAEREAQATYDQLDRGDILSIATGFPEVDKLLYGGGFWPGDLVVISGATSGGKTTFALNLADNAGEVDVKSLYFTMEMKTFKVFSRIHSSRAKVPGYKIRPHMTERYGIHVREKLRDTGARMSRLPIGFIDSLRDLETMRRVAKFAVREHGVQYLLFDYMGLMTPSRKFRGSRYDRATLVSEGLKELAGELNVPVIALSQLRRKYKEEKSAAQTAEGNEVEPTLDMLKESGSIENDADTVIFLWGEKGREGEEMAIRDIRGKIAKQRNGGLGRFELKFAPDIFTFKSMELLGRRYEGEPSF